MRAIEVIVAICLILILGMGIAVSQVSVKTDKLIIEGELQHHFGGKSDPDTFWVNGFRFRVEDRREAKVWVETLVGKRVTVTISSR